MSSSDKPTHNIHPKASQKSIENLKGLVSNMLHDLMGAVADSQDSPEVEKNDVSIDKKQSNQDCESPNDMIDRLIRSEQEADSQDSSENELKEKDGNIGEEYPKQVDTLYNDMVDTLMVTDLTTQRLLQRLDKDTNEQYLKTKIIIKPHDLSETATFLQMSSSASRVNLEMTGDNKNMLIYYAKAAVEEMASIAKDNGWDNIETPEVDLKEPLGVVNTTHSNMIKSQRREAKLTVVDNFKDKNPYK